MLIMQKLSLLFILCVLAGVFYAMGFPSDLTPSQMFTPHIGLAILLSTFFSKHRLNTKLLAVVFFSLGHYLFGFYWIPYTISEFGYIHFPYNQILGIIFSFILMPHFYLFACLNHSMEKYAGHILSRWPTTAKVSFYALFLTLLEYYIPQQFPAHLGHIWLHLAPHLGLTPFVGAPFYSFISYSLIVSVAMLKNTKMDRWHEGLRAIIFNSIFFILFLLMNISIKLTPVKDDLVLKARMVQANIGNLLKIQSENQIGGAAETVGKIYSELSLRPSNTPRELIIWPETAYPKLLNSVAMKRSSANIPLIIRDVVTQSQASLVTGGYDFAAYNPGNYFETEYNALFQFLPGDQIEQDIIAGPAYRKMHLIPFGEGLPFGPFNEWIGEKFNNLSFFAAGKTPTLFQVNGKKFGTFICYEILFSKDVRYYLNTLYENKDVPQFLINITNDSWYGSTSEPFQHKFLAKWRALEFQVPILRATNTGISSVLYTDGTESTHLGIGETGVLDVDVQIVKNPSPTLFQRWGIGITILYGIISLILAFVLRKFTFLKD